MLAFTLVFSILAQLFGTPVGYTAASASSTTGMLIGGYTNNVGPSATKEQNEEATEGIESAIGRNYAFQLHYYGMTTLNATTLASDPAVQGDLAHERMPFFSWTCGAPLTSYTSGAEDAYIDQAAFALKTLVIPVGLRFFHEFNLCLSASSCANGDNPACFAAGSSTQKGAQFIAAWEHIYNRFQADGATNVQFMWCPAGNATDLAATNLANFLPPLTYLSWISFDVYDRHGVGFAATITPFYSAFAAYNMRMILNETGELNGNPAPYTQAQYFTDLQNAPTAFPLLHAFSYFSATPATSGLDWDFDNGGITALAVTANMPYFLQFGY